MSSIFCSGCFCLVNHLCSACGALFQNLIVFVTERAALSDCLIRRSVILQPSIVFSDNYRDKPLQNGVTFNHCRLSEVPVCLQPTFLHCNYLAC